MESITNNITAQINSLSAHILLMNDKINDCIKIAKLNNDKLATLYKNIQLHTGILYMITSPSGKSYIGQHHTNDPLKRKKTHIAEYIRFLKYRVMHELKCKLYPDDHHEFKWNGCRALFGAFVKYGYYNFTWKVLKHSIPHRKLNEEEDKAILEHKTLYNESGYNLRLNNADGVTRMHTQAFLDNMALKKRKHHDKLEGMPTCVTYTEHEGYKGYKVVKHPKINGKRSFRSRTVPVETLKLRCLEYLRQIEETPDNTTILDIRPSHKESGLPKCIGIYGTGYDARVVYKKFRVLSGYFSDLDTLKEWVILMKRSLVNKHNNTVQSGDYDLTNVTHNYIFKGGKIP